MKYFGFPSRLFFQLYIQLVHPCFSLFSQQEIFVARNVAIKLYYEKFPDIQIFSSLKLLEWMERVME
jgi:hypothetical protein